MKIVFAGSPEFAVPVLEALLNSGKNVVAVITQPDKPVGRKRILTPTPVKVCAQQHEIPVYEFDKIKNHVSEVKGLGADVMITCAYGQILTGEVLNCFKAGVWNLHASLLPEFRGASPIQSAILSGKSHTGITVMKTELALDSGDILLVKRMEIGDKTYGELSESLSALAAEAAVEAVGLLQSGNDQVLMQDEAKATYCKKIEKAQAKIDFTKSCNEVINLIRAMSPAPLAWCNLNGVTINIINAVVCANDEISVPCGEVVEVNAKGKVKGEATGYFTVKCGTGAVNIFTLIPAGGKSMLAKDFINGRKIKVGDLLD